MRHDEWQQRMALAGFRTGYLSVRRHLLGLAPAELGRCQAAYAAWAAAKAACDEAARGQAPKHYDGDAALCLGARANEALAALDALAKEHQCAADFFHLVLREMARKGAPCRA